MTYQGIGYLHDHLIVRTSTRVSSVDPHVEDRGNDQRLIKNQQSHKTYCRTAAQSAVHLFLVCVYS